MPIHNLIAVVLLGVTHVLVDRLRFLHGIPRSVWLSAAGGVSVSYVFLHLLPELARGHATLAGEYPVFVTALAGLVVFYGLERLAKNSPHLERRGRSLVGRPTFSFWIHLSSFALYNLIIGYLLIHRPEEGTLDLALFALAMLLHFVVVDFGLLEDYHHDYEHVGRWVLLAALAVGWTAGALAELPHELIVLLTAFLGGGIILNVLKEELPEERKSRFSAFLAGTLLYALLLVYVEGG